MMSNFHDLLVRAKGSRSQAQFAKECGFSAEYLCRLMSGKDVSPRLDTLESIACHSHGGVCLKDLVEALGYSLNDVNNGANAEAMQEFSEADFEAELEGEVNLFRDTILGFVGKTLAYTDVFNSLSEAVESLGEKYLGVEVRDVGGYYGKDIVVEGVGDDQLGYMTFVLTDTRDNICKVGTAYGYIIFTTSTVDGEIMCTVVDGGTDVIGLERIYGVRGDILGFLERGGQESSDRLVVIKPYAMHRASAAVLSRRVSGEDVQTITTDIGRGFFVGELSMNNVAFFMIDHRRSLFACLKSFESGLVSRASDVLDKYFTDCSHNRGDALEFLASLGMIYVDGLGEDFVPCDIYDDWLVGIINLISLIMEYETHIRFDVYTPDTVKGALKEYFTRDMAIMAGCCGDFEPLTVMDVIGRYAKSLGVESFGDIYFTHFVMEFAPMKFRPKFTVAKENFMNWHWLDAGDTLPTVTGVYDCVFKDGRRVKCLYLADKGQFVTAHKDWSDWISGFNPKALALGDGSVAK